MLNEVYPVYSLSELIMCTTHKNLHIDLANRIKENGWAYIDYDVGATVSSATEEQFAEIPTSWQETLSQAFLLESDKKVH